MSVQLDTNKFTLRGRLGSDPEMKITASGKEVTTVSIATSWSKQVGTKDGKPVYEDQTDWHRVVFFGNDARIVHTNARKGDLFQCEGRISPRKYTDRENVTRYTIDFVGLTIEVMTWRQRANTRPNAPTEGVGSPETQTEAHSPSNEEVPAFNPDEFPG
jgi:single-strand DNA-binding protein